MTDYHCPLWLVDWDYEEDEDMESGQLTLVQRARNVAKSLTSALRSGKHDGRAWQIESAGDQLAEYVYELCLQHEQLERERDDARGEAAMLRGGRETERRILVEERDALAARAVALETGLRDLLPGAQWTARFDPDLRATVARIEALLHDTTSADEREARHEPPFAVLPDVY